MTKRREVHTIPPRADILADLGVFSQRSRPTCISRSPRLVYDPTTSNINLIMKRMIPSAARKTVSTIDNAKIA